MPPPPPLEELRTLESLRQRLVALSNTLASLRNSLEALDPLPPWSSIQSSANLLFHNLKQLFAQLESNQAFLAAAHVYPLPNFPASQQGILQQLLRKKLEPIGEEWVDESRRWALDLNLNASSEGGVDEGGQSMQVSIVNANGDGRLGIDELVGLWDWALMESNGIARGIDWGGEFTNEEKAIGVEHVAAGLGLKRNLAAGMEESQEEEDEEGEEEVEEDEEDEGTEGTANIGGRDMRKRPTGGRGGGAFPGRRAVEGRSVGMEKPMLPLEDIFRFISTGQQPRGATPLTAARTGV